MSTILVVDDDASIREILESFLEEEGYSVKTAADGQAALDFLAAEAPELLVAGVMMPRLTGWELLALVRRQWPALPAIVMSAFGPDRPPGSTRLPDHTVYLAKPFDLDELLTAVVRLIEASAQEHPAPE